MGCVFASCATTPNYSGYTNNQLVTAYHKTLTDLRYRQQSYNPDLESSRPYNSEKIAKLKEKMSYLRAEMFKRGLGLGE